MPTIATSPSRSLPRLVSVLLLIAVGSLAARLTWQVAEPDLRPPVSIEIPVEETAPATAAATQPSFADSADLPLFGVLGETAAVEPVVAPETRLRLRLIGLAASNVPEQGHAIIAESGNPEQLYTVGDSVGGGQARLHQIHADRVILERSGRYETLRLPRAEGIVSGSPEATRGQDSRITATPTADIPRIQRSEWLSDPERLLGAIQARPVIRDNMLHGLEVRPTRNARQFQQAGLRPGDVITSVNGIPLSAIDDTDRLFEDLRSQAQVDIVVERDGQAVPFAVQLTD